MKILGLIPARGGSKGIPRKNLAPFAGRPLLQWTCETAREATRLDALVLSTEDGEIARCGLRWGARVPFMRPAELARDDTPSLPVVQHALEQMDELGEPFDAVCLLQATNPLRTAQDIDGACALFERSGADSVVSVALIPSHFHPMWAYFRDDGGLLRQAAGSGVVPRRQELPPAYFREGSVYVTHRKVVLDLGSLYGERVVPYVMPPERCGGIDTPEDLRRLEERLHAAV